MHKRNGKRLKEEQVMIEKQWGMIEAEGKQRLQEQWEKTQDSIVRAKKGLEDLQNKTALVMGMSPQASRQERELEVLVTSNDWPPRTKIKVP